MALRSKLGLAYVLGNSVDHDNHILPVNAMDFDATSLYTAGRDGSVKVWNRGQPSSESIDTTFHLTDEDADVNLLKLEACISSSPLSYSGDKKSLFLTKNYNVHFDWINDLKLVFPSCLVSCSSDLSMKIINLHTDQVSKFANHHTDYIRKLSYDSVCSPNHICSGGLDGKINIWDLNTLNPVQTIDNFTDISSLGSNSIYSLANYENIVATGGPSHTINLFDRRSQTNPFVRKLIGHSDNIRCLMMNDRYVLSGSSDCSIKLWDLRTFKILKNFDIHDYPVWSISSESSDFSTFFSGDRSGRIIKTDISYLSSSNFTPIAEFNSFNSNDIATVDEKIGISTIIADEDSPIFSLCLQGDSIYSSNCISFNQYIVPNTLDLAKYQYLRTGIDQLVNKDSLDLDDFAAQQVTDANNQDDLNSEFYDLISHLSMDTHNVELQSTFLSNNLFDPSTPPMENSDKFDQMEEDFNSMFLNPNGGPSQEFINAYTSEHIRGSLKDTTVDETPVEILLNPIPSKNILQVPFNLKPLTEFLIKPQSVVAKKLFNNKRQIIALYLNGDIKIWDLLTCQEVRSWPNENNAGSLDPKELEIKTKQMESIYVDHQTNETLNNWCEVEIKAGKLFITLKESSFLNVEIYYDDMVRNYPFLSLDHPKNLHLKEKKVKASDDDRYYLGAILIHSWFHEYALFEWNHDVQLRSEFKLVKSELEVEETNSTSVKKFKYFSKRPGLSTASSFKSVSDKVEPVKESIITKSIPSVSLAVESNEDSIMKLIQGNKKHYIERSKVGAVESLLKVDMINPGLISNLSTRDSIPYYPRIDARELPQNLQIMIFEFTPELGNYRDVTSFELGELNDSDKVAEELRMQLPRWVGRPLLFNRYEAKEMPKIAFQLFECNYNELDCTKKIGGKVGKKIKKLPMLETSIKLTSHNMLRVRRILAYLTEKFESKTPEMKSGKPACEWLVLECKGVELNHEMTLQTIKTKIWKSSSEIELYFRRVYD